MSTCNLETFTNVSKLLVLKQTSIQILKEQVENIQREKVQKELE
jgi:hypothetical protein